MRNREHKQALRNDLHPCANRGHDQADPEEPIIAVPQGPEGLDAFSGRRDGTG